MAGDASSPDIGESLSDRYARSMRASRRGGLRILLGAAPGVGKTYAMLNEGRRLRAEGEDVVVGFVETHGRAETEAQIGDLEVVPRQLVPYKSISVEEMDVDAIIRRRPDLALVDELAHTNVPGSQRVRRYEDVEHIRDYGIDVLTTVNIQHLESLQDVVRSITGVAVRETLPDSVLDGATDVQLVDLPVELLIGRIEAGKVYTEQRAAKALQHFFQPGNLTALRELALRRTAEGVDDRLTDLMRIGSDAVLGVTERVLVIADGDDRGGAVLRSAWRLASALDGELIVVTTADAPSAALQDNIMLAEDLGARTVAVDESTADLPALVDALVELIERERISVAVAGVRIEEPRWNRRTRGISGSQWAIEAFARVKNLELSLVRIDRPAAPGPGVDLGPD